MPVRVEGPTKEVTGRNHIRGRAMCVQTLLIQWLHGSIEARHTHRGTTFLTMQRKRAHILLPQDLLLEIDQLVGERGRSAFLGDLARREIQRRKLLAALREARGSWKSEDHPELASGSAAFVERLRQENEARLKELPKS